MHHNFSIAEFIILKVILNDFFKICISITFNHPGAIVPKYILFSFYVCKVLAYRPANNSVCSVVLVILSIAKNHAVA